MSVSTERFDPSETNHGERARSSSYYVFRHPTPRMLSILCFFLDPLSVQTHDLNVSDSDQLLNSSESTNAQYSSDGVFSFDPSTTYTQQPVLVSTVVERPYPGYIRRDTPFIQHVISEMEEEKVEIIDSALHSLLARVKTEAELSEVEYGKLLKQIECGKVKNVYELIDSCLAMYVWMRG